MSRCPTITFQIAKVSKTNTFHTYRLKFHSKLFFGTDMFTLTYVYVDYEISISSWRIWNDEHTKMIILDLFQFATRLNSQNPFKTEIHNELRHINLYMNTGISNWHIWSIDHTKMRVLHLFQFDARLLSWKRRNSLVHNLWSEMERCE